MKEQLGDQRKIGVQDLTLIEMLESRVEIFNLMAYGVLITVPKRAHDKMMEQPSKIRVMSIPDILYHGTKSRYAARILKDGFRLAKEASYMGTGVCLTDEITTAYEYGAYEEGGCVLEVRLDPAAAHETLSIDDVGIGDYDRYMRQHHLDALETYGGNVWVLGNPFKVMSMRKLTHREALKLLLQRIDAEGPQMGYNGVAGWYADLWFGQSGPGSFARVAPGEAKDYIKRMHKVMGSANLGDQIDFDAIISTYRARQRG